MRIKTQLRLAALLLIAFALLVACILLFGKMQVNQANQGAETAPISATPIFN